LKIDIETYIISSMDTKEEKESLAQIFHRAIVLLRNHSTITRYQLQLRLATDKPRAERIYKKLREKEVIKEERWEDIAEGRMIIGIIDKIRLKEVREELMKAR
jgi:hypothetical protein